MMWRSIVSVKPVVNTVSVALHPSSSWLFDVINWDNLLQSCDSVACTSLSPLSWKCERETLVPHFSPEPTLHPKLTDRRLAAAAVSEVNEKMFWVQKLFLKISNHETSDGHAAWEIGSFSWLQQLQREPSQSGYQTEQRGLKKKKKKEVPQILSSSTRGAPGWLNSGRKQGRCCTVSPLT